MLTVFIDYTCKIKTNWTIELRISYRRVTDILCVALTLFQYFTIYFQVFSDPYAIQVQAFPFQLLKETNRGRSKDKK